MAKIGSMTLRASSVIGSRPIGSFAGMSSGLSVEPIPAAVEIHSEFAGGRGAHRLVGRLDRESRLEFAEDLIRTAAVEVADDAVVVEDRHLMMRKHHRQEIAVRSRAVARLRDPCRRRRAMVPVGDVDCRQRFERARQRRDRRVIGYDPHLVTNAVVGGDVDVRRAGARFGEQCVDLGRGWIAHHHRSGLGVDRLDLADAIVLLQRCGQLVLADPVGGVVRERRDRRETGLHAAVPGEPVDVIGRLGVADQRAALDHMVKVLPGLGVDRLVVRVDRRGEVDLRLRDVQEAPRLAFGALARLRAREDVIRRRQDFGGTAGRRP